MATGVPPLGRKNYQWWARTYGTRGPPHGARVHEAAREVAWSGDRERTLFDAIRANRVAQIERWIADSPAIAVTKVRRPSIHALVSMVLSDTTRSCMRLHAGLCKSLLE
jgi:hypothetical protein